MTFDEYRRKREFHNTPEPEGVERVKSGRSSFRFVIHKHKARNLHYDLRLEFNGALLSWAVPKGPSMNPEVKRLAVMTEDHPIEYKDFEGVIPKGNYGAGTVMIWDYGKYTFDIGKSKAKNFKQAIEAGHIAIVFQGKKIKGKFHLVKSGNEDWLLFKARDRFDNNEIDKEDISAFSGKRMDEIEQSNKAPWLDKSFQELLKGAEKSEKPHLIKPMLAKSASKPFDNIEWLFEVKFDGYRIIAEVSKGKVEIYSRNLNSYNIKFPSIVNALDRLDHDVIFDGEIVALNNEGIPEFQLLQNYEEPTILKYYVFDILFLDGYDLRNIALYKRKEILKKILPESVEIKLSEAVESKGINFYKLVVSRGFEGIIAKEKNSYYLSGKRSSKWLKIKGLNSASAFIAGYTKPRKGRKYFGALILGVHNNERLEYIGHCGTGFTDATQKTLFETMEKIKISSSPFYEPIKTNMPVTWISPKLICEVKYSEKTKDGLLRHPVFLGLRGDISYERIVTKDRLEITNPQKKLWPKENYTKLDLIEYYKKIVPYLLPYLNGRPHSLYRLPDGINGQGFYQKNMINAPDWVETVEIVDKNGVKTNYLVCNGEESVLYMANLGCIEMNPWSSKVGNLDRPDFMIVDLDPLEVPFLSVVAVALEVKKILDKASMKSFCKTSGLTGLHIYVPMGGKYSYAQVKNFAKIIAYLTNSALPGITSIERSPRARVGKVYLDYLQNNKGQTVAAPYSLRPVEGAPVSTPLSWAEVNDKLDPRDFNIKNIFQRLDVVGDIFSEVLGPGEDIKMGLNNLKK